jgi:hypothetical protein
MAQTVEHLPSKCEALSSTPSTAKEKENTVMSQAWWYMPVIPAHRRLKQEDQSQLGSHGKTLSQKKKKKKPSWKHKSF